MSATRGSWGPSRLPGLLVPLLGMLSGIWQAGEPGPTPGGGPGAIANGLIAYADCPFGSPGPFTQGAQIYTIRSDGTDRRRLTSTPEGNVLPAWSPDGGRIAFVSNRTGAPEIWLMNADGSDPSRLTHISGCMMPAWSPGGDTIAFVRPVAGNPQIWVVKADGTGLQQVTREGCHNVPTWSPDGTRIAFWSGDVRGYGQVWVMRADGTDRKQLTTPRTDAYTPRGSSANAPAWLFSERIVFWSGIEHQYGQIWSMAADGSDPQQLTASPAPISSDNPAWSADGRMILFDTSRRGRPEIWVMAADGSNPRPLVTDVRLVPARASWQPVR